MLLQCRKRRRPWLGGLPIEAGKAANWAAMPGIFLALAGFGLLFAKWQIHLIRQRERMQDRVEALQEALRDRQRMKRAADPSE